MSATSFHRQVLSALAAQSINISVGLCQGYSAVLLPQYSQENPEISFEHSSWIGMSITAYIYVTEVTTPAKRGLLNAVGPVLVSAGRLVAYTLGAFIDWRTIGAICAAVSLLTPILMYFVPESPLWLISRGYMQEAQTALSWFGRDKDTIQIVLMESAKDKSERLNFRQKVFLIKKKCVLKSFLILIAFFLFQELSGIYIILFYSVDFLKEVQTGFDENYATIIVGCVRLLMGITGTLLINNFERKTLAAASGLLLGATMFAAAVCVSLNSPPFIILVFVLLNVSFSMIGFLQLPWVMSGELYPQDIRGVMSGITLSCAYGLIFLSIKTYPQIESLMTTIGTLYFFSDCSVAGAIYCISFLPETKDKSLDEIIRLLEGEEKSVIRAKKNTINKIERKQNSSKLGMIS